MLNRRTPNCGPARARENLSHPRARVYRTFEVPLELEAELLESIAEADRGETIPADQVLRRLECIA